MSIDEAKRSVLEAARAMDQAGLTEGTAGNLSARTKDELAVLTPTAMNYATMSVDDLVVTKLDGEIVEGKNAPTTEIDLHLACLRRHPEIGGVVHSHAIYASMFAVAGIPIPCVLEEFELYVGDEVPVAPYHRTGTAALGEAAAEHVGDRAAVLLANHGLVVVGETPDEALQLTKLVDRAARITWGARLLGEPTPLPDEIRRGFQEDYLARRRRSLD